MAETIDKIVVPAILALVAIVQAVAAVVEVVVAIPEDLVEVMLVFLCRDPLVLLGHLFQSIIREFQF